MRAREKDQRLSMSRWSSCAGEWKTGKFRRKKRDRWVELEVVGVHTEEGDFGEVCVSTGNNFYLIPVRAGFDGCAGVA